jgi:hypothetical protein
MQFMEILLEKEIDFDKVLFIQEGMRASSIIQNSTFYARFIWKNDKCWHILNDPPISDAVWLKVRLEYLFKWSPDLWDPATAGIVLSRVSNLMQSQARFVESSLLLEDGRFWSKPTRLESLKAALN